MHAHTYKHVHIHEVSLQKSIMAGIPRSQERAICEWILGNHILQMEYD